MFFKNKGTKVEFFHKGKAAVIRLTKHELSKLYGFSSFVNSSRMYGTIIFGVVPSVFEGIFGFSSKKYAEIRKNISCAIYDEICWEIIN